jgi:transposase, IS30 family
MRTSVKTAHVRAAGLEREEESSVRASQRTPRFVAPAALIDRRPTVVDTRARLGDWEGDLITGRVNQSAIGTLVDRASRYVKLIHLPGGHSAHELRDGLTLAVLNLPPELRRTLTWDQGSEMACHDHIAHLSFRVLLTFLWGG